MKILLWTTALFFVCASAYAQCMNTTSDFITVEGLQSTNTLWKYGTWQIWDTTHATENGLSTDSNDDGRARWNNSLLRFQIQGETQFPSLGGAGCPPGNAAVKFDYEESGGAINHKGVYCITSGAVTGPPYTWVPPDCTARYIPTPTATLNGANVDLTWSAAVVEVAGDVTGYRVHRSTDGISFSFLNETASTVYSDVAPPSGSYYYALQLKYRTTAETVYSVYLSGNSNQVVVP